MVPARYLNRTGNLGALIGILFYYYLVQRRKVEKKFKDNGWYFVRHGGNHDIWSNGKIKTQLPRHPKFSDKLYNALIRKFNLK